MDQMERQWMPQAGLSICLSDPTAGQSQLPEPLSRNPLHAGLWMDATHPVSQCNCSDLFMQMKFMSRILVPV